MERYRKLLRLRVRVHAASWAGVGVMFMLSLGIGALAYHETMAAAQAKFRAQARAARAVRPEKPVDPEQARKWQALQSERNYPWDSLFLAIENTASTDIELLEFDPDAQHGRLLLRGEARNHAALVAFLEALSRQPQLHNVYLQRRQAVERERLVTVEFEIRATIPTR